MKWIDSGKAGVSIKQVEMPDGSFAIGVFGLTNRDHEWLKATTNHRFKVSVSGRVLLRQGAIRFSEAAAIFPRAGIADIPEESVFMYRKKPSDRSAGADTLASVLLGKNYLGQQVFVTSTGARYLQTGNSEGTVSEESVLVAPVFLRAKNPGDIDLCADGFVARADEEYLRPADLRRFCSIIHGDHTVVVEPTDSRLRDVQEAVESALFRRVSKEFQRESDLQKLFLFADQLNDRMPGAVYRTSTSIELQQYSTPVTLSIAAQYALGDTAGLRVLEPTIGNASLVSTMAGAEITGVEKDPSRVERTRSRLSADLSSNEINLIQGDFLSAEIPDGFDAVIANPPFGGLPAPIVTNGLRVTRIDHQILMKSLEARADNGRAVFIIGADHDNIYQANEGKLSGGSEKLFNWLTDHYEVSAFEVTGSLYKKQGAGYPVRMVAVGRKRSADEAAAAKESREFRIKELPVVKSADDLWNRASAMRSFLAESVSFGDAVDAGRAAHENRVAEENENNPAFGGNDYQSQYVPMVPGNTAAMIPKNLLAPQRVAFDRFLADHPDPVAFVKAELQMDNLDEFEAEQIDAIALGIWNMKRGRALILADQTGMGKGRIVAAIARWSALSGYQTNFLTEKAGLFSDIWRDIRDIQSEGAFTPFIMNQGEQVVSLEGDKQEVLVAKTTDAIRKTVLEDNAPTIDHGYNLMLATYSQFNRDSSKSRKSEFISAASNGAVLILDESHNAAGDSNTGYNITNAIVGSKAALYSSATYAKNAKNMAVYYKAFPPSVNVASLAETLQAGGETLQEVLSSMLCEDGVLVRREHDLSSLKFSIMEVPPQTLARNIVISDQVSGVLAQMAYISGDIERIAGEVHANMRRHLEKLSPEQRKGNRLGVSYTNFGSRLYNVSRQVSLILSADQVADHAIRALEAGQKPVIVLEQTMESVIRELRGMDQTEEEVLNGEADAAAGIEPLKLRELMQRLLRKLAYVRVSDDYGVSEERSAFELADGDRDLIRATRETFEILREQIEGMNDMIAMPIDVISNRLTNAGYTCGEVSGRSTLYTFTDDGKVIPEKNLKEKNREIFGFNSGEYDAMILTRSGCTGISLHASEKFTDQRQRVLIEAQIASNVSERVQFFGRVNRRGQVSAPEIWSVTSGLPWENRSLAMQNIKLRKLSANTQSNRNNAAEMKNIPDVLNAVGNEVCKDYLLNNPEVASLVAVDFDAEEEDARSGEDGFYFANRLTGRLCLLFVADQERVYEEITNDYTSRIQELTNKGTNPLEANVMDVKARVERRITLVAGQESGSVFDSPVYAEKITWDEEVSPIRTESIERFANASIAELVEKVPGIVARDINSERRTYLDDYRTRSGKNLGFLNTTEYRKHIEESAKEAMIRALPAGTPPDQVDETLQKQLDSKDMNFVRRIRSRSQWLLQNLDNLLPGCPIRFTSINGTETGVILTLGIDHKPGKEHLLGGYHIKVAVPGRQTAYTMTYNALVDDENFAMSPHDYQPVYKAFDTAPDGKISFSRWTLTGNLFKAVEMASTADMGRAGIYTTADGARHRAVICRPFVTMDDLYATEVSLSEAEATTKIVESMSKHKRGDWSFGAGMKLAWDDHGMEVKIFVPGTKSIGGVVFLNKEITSITGDFSGTRSLMVGRFSPESDFEDLKKVVSGIYSAGLSFKEMVTPEKHADASGVEENPARRQHKDAA